MMLDADLVRRLDALERSVRLNIDRFRAVDSGGDDPFRGMYVSDEHVDEMLAHSRPAPTPMQALPIESDSRMGRLARRFELDELDVAVLTMTVAPDLDHRYERLYGYLHDDVTRRRASIGLALDLSGRAPSDVAARRALSRSGALVAGHLLEVEDGERPFLTRSLRVPDRVLDHLLGDDNPDIQLLDVAVPTARRSGPIAEAAARAIAGGVRLVHLRERLDAGATGVAASALRWAGAGAPVCVDLERAHPDDQLQLLDIAVREARLIGGGLVVVNYDQLGIGLRRSVTGSPVVTFVIGKEPFDPDDAHVAPLVLDVDRMSADEQDGAWRRAIDDPTIEPLTTFRLGPRQIERAVSAGRAQALAFEAQMDAAHIALGARHQNAVGLERLAKRLEPSVGWNDIVLRCDTEARLRELVDRVAFRAQVYDAWQLRRGGGRGEGLIALFAGASGTGKTLAAEVIAAELGLELYVINLATVVDKYIGETEKNLERIFTEAEGVNAVLFFDEADALFGKRSEVSDARDRYANVEVAYLLQRLESFDGLGVLATNLKTNLDDAFARRLSMVVDFPDPDEQLRLSLWRYMTRTLPLDGDVDLEFMARQFELAGGNVRNIVVAAAFAGAAADADIAMSHFIHATKLEYQKLGRLHLEREFGPYYHQ